MDLPFNKDITYFARTNFRGTDQIFGIKRKDRRQHMYVLGKSGTGKSVMLENMIIQNIRQGEGVCVVDPHGELVEKILESIPPERANDVIYFNPADTDFNIGFNVLQLDDPKYKHLVASGLMGIFTKIWANAWSSRMEYILNNAILALLDTPDTTLLGIPRLLVDKDYRQYVINNLKDPVVKAFWVHEYEAWRDQIRNEAIAPIQNKVGQFLSSSIVRNVVGQSKSSINIFEIMNGQKIFLVNVSKGRIGEDNSALLGGMLITKLQLAAMERVRIPESERKDFYLYVDEFQNFVTDSFASILSEARKYRLCLILAHQYIAQLTTESGSSVRDAVFGNVGTMIIFRVGAEDADSIEKEFAPEFEVEDFVNLPNYHIYTKLMVDGVTSRPFSARTLPPVHVDVAEDTKEMIINTSRKLYTRPREDVESEINKWSTTVPGMQNNENEQMAGKFKVECSNDKKVIYVPFEPTPGLPVYCKECLFKIKNGELQPLPGYRAPREKQDTVSYDALATLGIEFKATATTRDIPRKPASVLNPVKQFISKPFVKTPAPTRPVEKIEPRPVAKPTFAPRTEPVHQPQQHSATNTSASPSVPKRETVGLQQVLKNAISSVRSEARIRPVAQRSVEQPKPSISLKNLASRPVVTLDSRPKNPLKDATGEKISLLRDAIAKAKKDTFVTETPPVAAAVTAAEIESVISVSLAPEPVFETVPIVHEVSTPVVDTLPNQNVPRAPYHDDVVRQEELEQEKLRQEEARLRHEREIDEAKKQIEAEVREQAAQRLKALETKHEKDHEEKVQLEQQIKMMTAERDTLRHEREQEAAVRTPSPAPEDVAKNVPEVPEDVLRKVLE